MDIRQILRQGTSQLKDSGIESARLDCLIIIEDTLKSDRSYILAHLEDSLSIGQVRKINNCLQRRSKHEPLAYIRKSSAFYGRQFFVDNSVLIPRPETEDIINMLLKLKEYNFAETLYIADIGTGSGCLGITAVLEHPKSVVDLYDNSINAIKIAKINAKSLEACVRAFYMENLLANAKHRKYDIIVCNLPYVPKNMELNVDATFEPRSAIYSNYNGFSHYEKLWLGVSKLISKPKYIITESLLIQHQQMRNLAEMSGFTLIGNEGLAQTFKKNEV